MMFSQFRFRYLMLRIFFMTLLAAQTLSAWSVVYHVNLITTGANNGLSWADAFPDLQSALAIATSGDEIWVAVGTYMPTSGTDRTQSFILPAGVGVYGGFEGNEALRSDRDLPTTPTTILSGNIGNAASASDNTYRVVRGGASAILDGFWVRDGYAVGTGNNDGAGVVNVAQDFSIKNAIISNNRAGDEGGGVFNAGNSLTMTNCRLMNNRADMAGGGLHNQATTVTLTGCMIDGNQARYGAGASNEGAGFFVSDCVFTGNINAMIGGGLRCTSVSTVIDHCRFNDNSAGWGGAIYITSGANSNSIVANSEFVGNRGVDYGGAIYSIGNTRISFSIFENNSVNAAGGGLYLTQGGGLSRVEHCQFIENTADRGGGVYTNFIAPDESAFEFCTFEKNQARQSGGGAYFAEQVSLDSCIFFDNRSLSFDSGSSAAGGGGFYLGESNLAVRNCVVTSNSASLNGVNGGRGGGIFLRNSEASFVNCTITNNFAAAAGGAIYKTNWISIINSVLWNNFAPLQPECYGSATYKNSLVRNSDLGGFWSSNSDGGGNLALDPRFYAEQSPAGLDGILMTADDGLRLKPASPCLNAALGADAPPADILGVPRIGIPDIGAYEGFLQTAAGSWLAYD